MAPLRYAAKFDPFLSLDCAPGPPPWRHLRKGRDQILPSGNTDLHIRNTTESNNSPPEGLVGGDALEPLRHLGNGVNDDVVRRGGHGDNLEDYLVWQEVEWGMVGHLRYVASMKCRVAK